MNDKDLCLQAAIASFMRNNPKFQQENSSYQANTGQFGGNQGNYQNNGFRRQGG